MKKCLSIIIACLLLSVSLFDVSSIFAQPVNDEYHNNILIVKTKQMQNLDKNGNVLLSAVPSLSLKLESLGVKVKSARAPFAKYYRDKDGNITPSKRGLERICEIQIEKNENILIICRELMKDPSIEYAEPMPKRYLHGWTPNDPSIKQQWHLDTINAYDAWEVAKDKTGVVIGIVDSGTDWQHEDLQENIRTNPDEIPNNGKDDDGNGYTDDIHGWDFVGNFTYDDMYGSALEFVEDNDPKPYDTEYGYNTHGTHVAGLAAAVANNGKGGAGIGINCKILATKHSSDIDDRLGLYRGYEGIIYTAHTGAKIINCSWGGSSYGYAENDVIQEVIDMGVTILVAAGNNGKDNDVSGSYPANYDRVISVGASDQNDMAIYFSNYGYCTSIFAPGVLTYSTFPNNKYEAISGTSMASPVAAGTAGLVLSVFPEYTPKQVYHQLRSTGIPFMADGADIHKFPSRIDAYKAVVYNNPDYPGMVVPGISIVHQEIPPIVDIKPYDIGIKLKNYIGKANNLQVKVSSIDNYLHLTGSSTFNIGTMNMSEEKDIAVEVQIDRLAAISEGKAKLLVEYMDGSFYDYEVLYVPINMPTQNTNTLTVCMSSSLDMNAMHCHNDTNSILVGQYTLYDYYYRVSYAIPYYLIMNETGWVDYGSIYLNNSQGHFPNNVYAINDTHVVIGAYTYNDQGAAAGSAIMCRKQKTAEYWNDWVEANTSHITDFIAYLTFFDNQNGLLVGRPVGNKWGIAKSSDGGETWQQVHGMPDAMANERCTLHVATKYGNNVWFGTSMGRVYTSKDRGSNWRVDTVQLGAGITAIGFGNESIGMAIYTYNDGADMKKLLATTLDGGNTWKTDVYDFMDTKIDAAPMYIYFNDDVFYVVFDNNMILASEAVEEGFGKLWVAVPNKELYNTEFAAGIPYTSGNSKFKIKSYGINSRNNNIYPTTDNSYLISTTHIVKPDFDICAMSVEPSNEMHYGKIALDKDSTKTIIIRNTGSVNLLVTDLTIAPDNTNTSADEFIPDNITLPLSITAGNSCPINVKFSPEILGYKEATLKIGNNSDYTPVYTVKLTGECVENVSIYVTDTTVFAPVSPNPGSNNNQAFTSVYLEREQYFTMELFDARGNNCGTVYGGTGMSGKNVISINTKNLTAGSYYLVLNLHGKKYMNSFIIE